MFGKTEVTLRPSRIRVEPDDGLVLVKDLAGAHQEGPVPACGDDHVRPLDDLVGVLLVPLHYLDLHPSLLQSVGHGHL